jgi:glycosyltransferase involved in cell wall biosynthesis
MLVSDVYPPIIGGAELQTQLLAKKLSERGHRVVVATSWQVGLPEVTQEDNVTVYRVKGLSSRVPWFSTNPNRRLHPPLPDPGAIIGLRQLINQVKPDVTHSYGWITYSLATALMGKRTPLVVAMREYAHTCALRTMLQDGKQPCSGPATEKCLRCSTTFFGKPKGVVAFAGVRLGKWILRHKVRGVHNISTYMQQIAWRDLFGDSTGALQDAQVRLGQGNRVVVDAIVPSFRDAARDAAEANNTAPLDARAAEILRQLPNEPFIFFVGALRKVKGLEPLLKAHSQLRNAPPLVLAGVPSTDTPKTFPESVKVLTNVPNAVVMKIWERALFGVAPSIWPEPFGNVVHEAMSKGNPVIGTTPGGHTDMILDGETGFLVPPGDADALAAAMQKLIDSSELRARMGAAARARARLFTSDVTVPKFEQLFYDAIDRTAPAMAPATA